MKPKKIQKVIVKGVITRGRYILLLKDRRGYWDLPGGKLEFGETPEECLEREIREEIGPGANIEIGGLTCIQTIILNSGDLKEKPELRHYLVLVYKGRMVQFNDKDVPQDKKITDRRWVSLGDLIKGKTSLPVLSILKEQLLSNLKGPVKTHTKAYLFMGQIESYRKEKYL